VITTGLDPNTRYQVSVRALGASGTPGPGVMTYMPSDPMFACNPFGPDENGDRSRQMCSSTPQQPPLPR
jgi:hypothetical protein